MKYVSSSTMEQSDSVVVLGAGPSLDKVIHKVVAWQKEKNALSIGVHYCYKIKCSYTLFLTPAKFFNSKKKVKGMYILGPRIKYHSDRVLRPKYGEHFFKWTNYDFLEKNEILFSACGFEAVMCAGFCGAKNIMMVGFDGYEIRDNKLVVQHSTKHSGAPKGFKKFSSLKRKETHLRLDRIRQKKIYELIEYFTNRKNTNIYIFNEDRFKGIDKTKFANNSRVTVL